MSWTSPMTAVANEIFTASQFNTHVRDNLLETAPGIAANAGGYFVTTGTNSISERVAASAIVGVVESTTSNSYTDLATVGPEVTVTTGTQALVHIACALDNDTTDSASLASFAVSGSTAVSAVDDWSVLRDGSPADNDWRIGATHLATGLTAGSNTFTMKYRAGSGTAEFFFREIIVVPL